MDTLPFRILLTLKWAHTLQAIELAQAIRHGATEPLPPELDELVEAIAEWNPDVADALTTDPAMHVVAGDAQTWLQNSVSPDQPGSQPPGWPSSAL